MKKLICVLFLLEATFADAQRQCTPADVQWKEAHEKNYYCQNFGFDIPDNWNKKLYDTLENWMGAPYKYAGSAHDGTDCSGFVTVLYTNVYCNDIGARRSADIYNKVRKIDRKELAEGDLVFFRIRKKQISHVGLYLGANKFVHASSGSGVIISDLQDPYYRKYFAGAGRIPLLSAQNK